jgi:hypothetical protein
MTRRAGSRCYAGVIERRGLPCAGAMARVAGLRGRQVDCILTGRRGAVMTRRASTRCYTGVIKRRRFPCGRAVACVTSLRGR